MQRMRPLERIDRIEPAEATDRIDPAEPTDRIEPAEPTDRIDPAEPMDRIDPTDSNDWIEPTDTAELRLPVENHDRLDHRDEAEATVGSDVGTVTTTSSLGQEGPGVLGSTGPSRRVTARPPNR